MIPVKLYYLCMKQQQSRTSNYFCRQWLSLSPRSPLILSTNQGNGHIVRAQESFVDGTDEGPCTATSAQDRM